MKNVLKVFGIIALAAVMGFSFSACSTDGGGGEGEGGRTLTITGLEAYEGKYIYVQQKPNFHEPLIQNGHEIYLASSSPSSSYSKKVVDGTVTLTMLIGIEDGRNHALANGNEVLYRGTHDNVSLEVYYLETKEGWSPISTEKEVIANFSAENPTVAYPAE